VVQKGSDGHQFSTNEVDVEIIGTIELTDFPEGDARVEFAFEESTGALRVTINGQNCPLRPPPASQAETVYI